MFKLIFKHRYKLDFFHRGAYQNLTIVMLELYAMFCFWAKHQNLDILQLQKRKLQRNVIKINLTSYSKKVFVVTESFIFPILVSTKHFPIVEADTFQKAFIFSLAL